MVLTFCTGMLKKKIPISTLLFGLFVLTLFVAPFIYDNISYAIFYWVYYFSCFVLMLSIATSDNLIRAESYRKLFRYLLLFQLIFICFLLLNDFIQVAVLKYNWRYELAKAIVLVPFVKNTPLKNGPSLRIGLTFFLFIVSLYTSSTGCALLTFLLLSYLFWLNLANYFLEYKRYINLSIFVILLLSGFIFRAYLFHDIRSKQMLESFNLLQESNYFGFGPGTWLKYADYSEGIDPFWNHVGINSQDNLLLNHSFYFNLLAESGVLSLFTFIVFLSYMLFKDYTSLGIRPEVLSILITLFFLLIYLSCFNNEDYYSIIFTLFIINCGIIQNE